MLPFIGWFVVSYSATKIGKVQTLIKKDTEEFTIMTTRVKRRKKTTMVISRGRRRGI